MEHIAILVASSPTTSHGRRALDLAQSLSGAGHQVTLALLEDAVLAGTHANLGLPVASCASVLVLGNDLARRGFGPGSLLTGCQTCTYDNLVDLMLEKADRTLGLF